MKKNNIIKGASVVCTILFVLSVIPQILGQTDTNQAEDYYSDQYTITFDVNDFIFEKIAN